MSKSNTCSRIITQDVNGFLYTYHIMLHHVIYLSYHVMSCHILSCHERSSSFTPSPDISSQSSVFVKSPGCFSSWQWLWRTWRSPSLKPSAVWARLWSASSACPAWCWLPSLRRPDRKLLFSVSRCNEKCVKWFRVKYQKHVAAQRTFLDFFGVIPLHWILNKCLFYVLSRQNMFSPKSRDLQVFSGYPMLATLARVLLQHSHGKVSHIFPLIAISIRYATSCYETNHFMSVFLRVNNLYSA